MAQFTWQGGAGVWNDASDWAPQSVPGGADTVVFQTASSTVSGAGTVTSISVIQEALDITGTVRQQVGATSTFVTLSHSAVTVDVGAVLSGNSFIGDAASRLVVNGTARATGLVTATVVSISGSKAELAAGTLSATSVSVIDAGTFAGTLNLADNGLIELDAAATLAAPTIDFAGDATFHVINDGAAAVGSVVGDVSLGAQQVLTFEVDQGVTFDDASNIQGGGVLVVRGSGASTSGTLLLKGQNALSSGIDLVGGNLAVRGEFGESGAIFLDNSSSFAALPDSVGTGWSGIVVAGHGSNTINNSDGQLVVFGGVSGTTTYQGGVNASTVVGTSGTLIANAGVHDVIFGGTSGQDQITGGNIGNCTIVGGSHGGTLNVVGSLRVAAVAAQGNTTVNASAAYGNDTLFGGNQGSTFIETGTGHTTVVGGADAETIVSNGGSQLIFVGKGGAELEFIHNQSDVVNVVGFDVTRDTIHLSGFSGPPTEIAGYGSTILTLSDNTKITLFGVADPATIHFI